MTAQRAVLAAVVVVASACNVVLIFWGVSQRDWGFVWWQSFATAVSLCFFGPEIRRFFRRVYDAA